MDAHALPGMIDLMLRTDFCDITDPGASGTFNIHNMGFAKCEVVTAAAESRVLPSAVDYAIGQILLVILKTAGGALTMTGATPSALVLATAGDAAAFIVSLSGSTRVWRVIGNTRTASANSGTKTIDIPIGNNWRAPTALITNLAGADSGSGSTAILGLETGAIGTAGNGLNLTSTTPSSVTASARDNTSFLLPSNYRAGTDLTIRLNVNETVAAGTAAEVDVIAVDQDDPTTDICATVAQSIMGAAFTDYNFTITGTNLSAGDCLDVRVSLFQNGAGTNVEHDIVRVQMLYTAG